MNYTVEDLGEGPSLVLDQTEARRVEKKFFETGFPPYLRVWMTATPVPYLKVLNPPLL